MPTTTTPPRWNFRVDAEANEMVRQAAVLCHCGLTQFVVRAATVEAERIMADRTRFVLDRDEWDQFTEMLDRPAQPNERLARLLSKPSIFD